MNGHDSRLSTIDRHLAEIKLTLSEIDRKLTRHDPDEAARERQALRESQRDLERRLVAREIEARLESTSRKRWDAVVGALATGAAAIVAALRGGA